MEYGVTVTVTAARSRGPSPASLPLGSSESGGSNQASDRYKYTMQLALADSSLATDTYMSGIHYLAAARIAAVSDLGPAYKKAVKRGFREIGRTGREDANAITEVSAAVSERSTPEALGHTLRRTSRQLSPESQAILKRLDPMISDIELSRSEAAAKAAVKCFIEVNAIKEAIATSIEFNILPLNYGQKSLAQELVVLGTFHGKGTGRELVEFAVSRFVNKGLDGRAERFARDNGFPDIAEEIARGRFTGTQLPEFPETKGIVEGSLEDRRNHELADTVDESRALIRPLSFIGSGLVSDGSRERLPVPDPAENALGAWQSHMHNRSYLAANIVARKYHLGEEHAEESQRFLLLSHLKLNLIIHMRSLMRDLGEE